MSKYLKKIVVKQCIAELLSHGFTISVNDGEEITVINSRHPDVIFAAMMTTDEDHLIVEPTQTSPQIPRRSWVRFVYGNDGWDVINDYNTSLEPFLTKTSALIDEMQE